MKILAVLVAVPLWFLTVAAAESPYQTEIDREIKSLSPAEIEGLKKGKGMGFAKAAELNHYPGPKHVLELADALELSGYQLEVTTEIYQQMQTEAIRLGQALIKQERELDRLFAERRADTNRVKPLLTQIAHTRADLRGVHLLAHLQLREVLTPEQIGHYDKLRGYSSAMKHTHHGH